MCYNCINKSNEKQNKKGRGDNMQGQTEIFVVIDGVEKFEYLSYVVPRIGESVSIELDGLHIVRGVTHGVYKDSRGDLITCATIFLESTRF